MLDEHRRLILPKLGSNDKLELEVNWRPDDKTTNGCKVIRIYDGDKHYEIKRDDLVNILLVFGDINTQKKLLPVQVRRVKRIERLLHGTIKAKKSYAPGDTVEFTVPWIDEIPIDQEVFAGNLDKLKDFNSTKTKVL